MNLTYVKLLQEGKTVSFRPHGGSMTPKIESGQLVTVSPDVGEIKKGDILFCKVKGRMFCHLVSAVQGERYQISNNHGHVNGWIGRNGVYGKVVRVEA
jgi:phage repressor protein C with HTH and peptisase S24 domain